MQEVLRSAANYFYFIYCISESIGVQILNVRFKSLKKSHAVLDISTYGFNSDLCVSGSLCHRLPSLESFDLGQGDVFFLLSDCQSFIASNEGVINYQSVNIRLPDICKDVGKPWAERHERYSNI